MSQPQEPTDQQIEKLVDEIASPFLLNFLKRWGQNDLREALANNENIALQLSRNPFWAHLIRLGLSIFSEDAKKSAAKYILQDKWIEYWTHNNLRDKRPDLYLTLTTSKNGMPWLKEQVKDLVQTLFD